VGMVYPGDTGIPRSTYNEDLNNYAPRVGFAWDVLGNGKLSMRGGWGIFYDIPISELTLQFLGVPPYGIQTLILENQYKNPYPTSLQNPIPNPFPFVPAKPGAKYDFTQLAPIGITVMDPGFRTPYGQQANLQLQYQIHKDWLLETGYVYTNGVKLLRRIQANPAIPAAGATSGNIDRYRVLNHGYHGPALRRQLQLQRSASQFDQAAGERFHDDPRLHVGPLHRQLLRSAYSVRQRALGFQHCRPRQLRTRRSAPLCDELHV
jgi:hypothetical protein